MFANQASISIPRLLARRLKKFTVLVILQILTAISILIPLDRAYCEEKKKMLDLESTPEKGSSLAGIAQADGIWKGGIISFQLMSL